MQGVLSFFDFQLPKLIKIPREENWVQKKLPSCGNSALSEENGYYPNTQKYDYLNNKT